MIKKVYVLVNEWTIDGGCNEDSGIEISVFDTLSYAQENMFNSAECWLFENQTDKWERIESNDSMSIECYIEGSYLDNHILWYVEEKEINEDPERQYDRNGDVLNVGDRVLWYDPVEEFRDLQRAYKIFDIDGDIIRISDEYSEVECPANELELYHS